MDTCVQFSVFLLNSPGVLSQIFQELAKAKVNVAGIALMDSAEHGVLRMVVEDPKKTRVILKQLDVRHTEADILAVPLANRPGAVADVCERLTKAHINVGYMYCTTGAKGGKSVVFLKVPSIKKAEKVLNGAKLTRRDMKVKLRRPVATTRR